MSDVPDKIKTALLQFGYSEEKISKLSGDTLLVQDLGIWGDDADDLYEILSDVYGSKNIITGKYSPSEFAWMRQPILWVPFVSTKKNLKCDPLSLKELDEIMKK